MPVNAQAQVPARRQTQRCVGKTWASSNLRPHKLTLHFTLEQETFLFLITPIPASFMQKRNQIDTSKIMYQAEELISAASNRYRITVQVANRAKRRRYEDFDSLDDPLLKPVIRAIIEMSDELTQPEIIGE